ncbi:MAG: hypothetical protein HOP29_02500 [Phycisphaerales bacterium]|nr:hypothetical protein [Phycisphaerales bacterium]
MIPRSIWLVDAAGLAVTAGLLSAVSWYALLKPDTASSQVHALQTDVAQARADLRQLHGALDEKTNEYRTLMKRSEQVGKLPEKSPIDFDLRSITAVAKSKNVEFLHVEPIATILYPDVTEFRYHVRAGGAFADQLSFFESFESCSFWADVTHVRLSETKTPSTDGRMRVESDLTLSFYESQQ